MLHASEGLASYNSAVMNRAAAIPPATPMTSPIAATVATSATITPIDPQRSCAERQANPDLSGSLHDAVAEDAIEPDGDQHDRGDGEERGEQRERPVAHQVVIDERGLQGHVGHAESRMYSRQLVPKHGSQGARFESRPHLNRGHQLLRPEGVVNSRWCCLANVGVLRVCCDADDFLGDQSGSSVDAEESLTER